MLNKNRKVNSLTLLELSNAVKNSASDNFNILLQGITDRVDKIQVAAIFVIRNLQNHNFDNTTLNELTNLVLMMKNWRSEIALLKSEVQTIKYENT